MHEMRQVSGMQALGSRRPAALQKGCVECNQEPAAAAAARSARHAGKSAIQRKLQSLWAAHTHVAHLMVAVRTCTRMSEPVLDDLVAHVRPGLVLVGGHELARVQVHVQADEPVAQLAARHERVHAAKKLGGA